MMTELDQVIAKAFATTGKQEEVNKVYLTLFRTVFYVPVEKNWPTDHEEPFKPLFANIAGNFFMVAFDTFERCQEWAGNEASNMAFVELVGKDVIAGLGDEAYLSINVGTPYQKEFSPAEIKRLKMIVSRIDQLKNYKVSS